MPTGEVKTKLTLDGEKEYKAKLAEARAELKLLRSELKAESAELGRNASEQEKNAVKSKSLQQQIKAQEKVVAELRKALEQAKKQYPENQQVQDKWAISLNKAREELAKMKTELDSTGESMTKMASNTQSAASSVQRVSDATLDLKAGVESVKKVAGDIGGAIEGAFNATYNSVRKVVLEIYTLMSDAWTAAGSYENLTDLWGGSSVDAEVAYRTAKRLTGSTDVINKAIDSLVERTHSGQTDGLFAMLGIKESDFDNHLDMFMEVMRLITEYPGDRDSLLEQAFGTSKDLDLIHLFDDWQTTIQDVRNSPTLLGEATIKAASEVEKKINEVKQAWEDLKQFVGAKLVVNMNIPAISDNLVAIMDDLARIFAGDKSATKDLSVHFGELVDNVSIAIENIDVIISNLVDALKEADNPILNTIGSFVEKIWDSMKGIAEWISTHQEDFSKIIDWVLKNKIVEATTGKDIPGWATWIIETGIDIAMLVKLVKTLRLISTAAAEGASTAEAAVNSAKTVTEAFAEATRDAAAAASAAAEETSGVTETVKLLGDGSKDAAEGLGEAADKANALGESASKSVDGLGDAAEVVKNLSEAAEDANAVGSVADDVKSLGEAADSVTKLGDVAEGIKAIGEAANQTAEIVAPEAGNTATELSTKAQWLEENLAEVTKSASEATEAAKDIIIDLNHTAPFNPNHPLPGVNGLPNAQVPHLPDASTIPINEIAIDIAPYIESGAAIMNEIASSIPNLTAGTVPLLGSGAAETASAVEQAFSEAAGYASAAWVDIDGIVQEAQVLEKDTSTLAEDLANISRDSYKFTLFSMFKNELQAAYIKYWKFGAGQWLEDNGGVLGVLGTAGGALAKWGLGALGTVAPWLGLIGGTGLLAYGLDKAAAERETQAFYDEHGYYPTKEDEEVFYAHAGEYSWAVDAYVLDAIKQFIEEEGRNPTAEDYGWFNQDTMEEMESILSDPRVQQLMGGDISSAIPYEWYAMRDLFANNGNGADGTEGLTSRLSSAVSGSLSGWRIQLDGATVGNMVAPYVNENIAGMIIAG